jgi:hypothetical protein
MNLNELALEHCQRYGKFSPTGFDSEGAFLPDRQEWLVAPVSRNRDSGSISHSNFDAAIKILDGESDTVEVHRFGHWGPGWFEIILVNPEDEVVMEKLGGIITSLENYPLLDEDDCSNREFEEACEAWGNTSIKERIVILDRHNLSIFAARREEIPQGLPHYEDFYTVSW